MAVLLFKDNPRMSSYLIFGLVCLFAAFVANRLRSTAFHRLPLAHWTCSFSPVWILWQRYKGRELKAVLAAHQKHGKIVRVAPSELSISDYNNGVRQVYNAGFEKPHYFDFFQYYGQRNSFASRSRADHAACRRRISTCYSKTTLVNSKSLSKQMQKILYGRLLPVLEEHAVLGQPAELLRLFYAAGLDMLNCYIFGLDAGPNFTQDPEFTNLWLHHYENRYAPQSFWLQEAPWLAAGLKRIGWDVMPREHYTSTKWIEDWMLGICSDAESVYRKMLNNREDVADEDVPIVYSQLRKAMSNMKDDQFLGMPITEASTRLSIASEVFDHMSGAREVFGLVFSYALYYIAQNPEQQARLQHEVAHLGLHLDQQRDAQDLPARASPQAIEALTYLQAVIKESLRMRPNSTPLPRITPADQAVSIAGCDGIPPNTRVNCFQWFLHRDPALWAEPDQWVPERWLDELTGQEKRPSEMPQLWAFVTGPRACVGMQMTYYLFGYALAAIFSNFTVEVAKPETYGKHYPGSLEDELWLNFHSLKTKEGSF